MGSMPTMAYATQRMNGSWELRESTLTPRGPRSRTLVTFRELDDGAIAKALERSARSLDASSIRSVARRAGAPVALPEADRAALTLVRSLARGEQPSAGIRRALLNALEGVNRNDAERAAADWLDASPERRGRALWDLLLLADRLPSQGRPTQVAFPPLRTGAC